MTPEEYEEYFIRFEHDGKEIVEPYEEKILSKLLADEICFINYFKYICGWPKDNTDVSENRSLNVLIYCNDWFGWACSDAEEISSSQELVDLFEEHIKDETYGSCIWASKKRNLQPFNLRKKSLIEQNKWTAELEALTENNRG